MQVTSSEVLGKSVTFPYLAISNWKIKQKYLPLFWFRVCNHYVLIYLCFIDSLIFILILLKIEFKEMIFVSDLIY